MEQELKPCPYCGTLGSSGCDDISLAPGQNGRSKLCYQRQIHNLQQEVEKRRDWIPPDKLEEIVRGRLLP